MDKETREFLENMQEGINEFRKETNERFEGIEARLNNLEGSIQELRTEQEEIIENKTHLKLYQEGMDEFEKDNTTYTYDEVLKELGLKKEAL